MNNNKREILVSMNDRLINQGLINDENNDIERLA
jgi:hypothetical protein